MILSRLIIPAALAVLLAASPLPAGGQEAPEIELAAPPPAVEAPGEAVAPTGDPAEPAPSEEAAKPPLALSERLFAALLDGGSADDIARMMEQAFQRRRIPCEQIRDFQVYRSGTGYRTLKVKCVELPLYVLHVDNEGTLNVGGGNGLILPMDPLEGEIRTVFGVRADRYLEGEQGAGDPAAPQVAARSPTHWSDTLKWLLVVSLIFFGAIALLVFMRSRIRRGAGLRQHGSGSGASFSSEEKNELLDDAREVYPNLFEHPSGMFIARGPHGKRRVFRGAFGGFLYTLTGVKIGEIR